MLDVAIIAVAVLTGAILAHPRVRRLRTWRATTTPLASIIGSGFLVLGPILVFSYGYFALLVMAFLCLAAYLFGAAVRFNIATIESDAGERPLLERRLESFASWALAFAYFISVAYYLNLFGAFGVRLTPFDDALNARILTSGVLVLILVVGWTRGFTALERLEQISVGIKLAIIAALLIGLVWFFAEQVADRALIVHLPVVGGWPAVALALGLIITVQGFETSRYLGDTYSAATRTHSMRLAQWLSSGIYMLYIAVLSFLFDHSELTLEETSIIDLMQVVAPVLPALLVAAALSAQFSAAVADTSGSGGLIAELTKGRIATRQAYVLLVAIGLALTWTSDVFEIITYASRAFGLYYALQAAIAAASAWRRPGARLRAALFAVLAVLGVMIVLFGAPVE